VAANGLSLEQEEIQDDSKTDLLQVYAGSKKEGFTVRVALLACLHEPMNRSCNYRYAYCYICLFDHQAEGSD
jgi:hypothetical protein